MWEEMMALLLNLHLEPHRLLDKNADSKGRREGVWKNGAAKIVGSSLSKGYQFGSWRLFYNELESPLREYNPCTATKEEK